MLNTLLPIVLAWQVAAVPLANSTSSAHASTPSSRPLATTNLSSKNLKECSVPTIDDVPFDADDIHRHVDMNTNKVDYLGTDLWKGLSMDAWLAALISKCPALSLPGNYAAGQTFEFPVALGKVLLDSSETLRCSDMEDCTWSNLGNIPGADRPPTVPDLSNDSITDLRKWYALSALSEIHFYFRHMKNNFDQAATWNSQILAELIQTLNPSPPPEDKGFDVSAWVDMVCAILAFTPLDEIAVGLEEAVDTVVKVKDMMDKFQKVAASNLKDSAADSFNAFDKDGHFAKYASFAAGFSGAMHSMSNSMSAVWQKSMYGDPSAGKGGYLDVVTGGAFSKKQSGSPQASSDMQNRYQKYVLEKAAMSIWRNRQIFLYTSWWSDKAGCDSAVAANVIPGQACYQNDDGKSWTYYAPLQPEFDLESNAILKDDSESHPWYKGLFGPSISTANWNMGWRDIYINSCKCFEANNLDHVDPKNYLVGSAGLNLYSPEKMSYLTYAKGGEVPSDSCHWNLPVLNSNYPAAAEGCRSLHQSCATEEGEDSGWTAPPCTAMTSPGHGNYRFLAYGSQLFSRTTPIKCNVPPRMYSPVGFPA